jgi:hypothetical protein
LFDVVSLSKEGGRTRRRYNITTCSLMSQWESSACAHATDLSLWLQPVKLRYTLEDIVLLLGVLTVM